MDILVTGASGFLGTALIPKLIARGDKIYGLSRHPPKAKGNLIPVKGDILVPNLGIEHELPPLEALYHLAAVHRLGGDRDGSIWQTNVGGTQNVIEFCKRHGIPRLYFVSSAYTQGRNPYEQSKALCETLVAESGISHVTIFKPSIILGTPQHFYPGHLSQFISLVIKVHQNAERVRRWLQDGIRLPGIEPVLRFRANPNGKSNVISIDDVARAIVQTEDTGTYQLTHPDPPTIGQLVQWIGEFILVRMQITADFKPSSSEALFQRLSAAFTPYLWGDNFPSDIKQAQPITKEVIRQTIIKTLFA